MNFRRAFFVWKLHGSSVKPAQICVVLRVVSNLFSWLNRVVLSLGIIQPCGWFSFVASRSMAFRYTKLTKIRIEQICFKASNLNSNQSWNKRACNRYQKLCISSVVSSWSSPFSTYSFAQITLATSRLLIHTPTLFLSFSRVRLSRCLTSPPLTASGFPSYNDLWRIVAAWRHSADTNQPTKRHKSLNTLITLTAARPFLVIPPHFDHITDD